MVGDLKAITQVVENLGVPKPQRCLLKLFFVDNDKCPRDTKRMYKALFTQNEMEDIFRAGDLPQKAVDYFNAKKEGKEKLCEEIYKEALKFIPTRN